MSQPSESQPSARVLLLVAVGGAAGSLARWGMARAFDGSSPADGAFPWPTFLVNVVGCFALGVLVGWLADRRTAPWWWRPLLAVGLLGGFTTFSTYVLDARDLLAAGDGAVAALAVVGEISAGLLAVVVGLRLGRRLGRGRRGTAP